MRMPCRSREMTIGDLRAGHAADFAEKMALRIEFALGAHRAVKGHVDAVDLVEPLLDRLEEFARELAPSRGRQQAGASRPCGVCRDDGDVLSRFEDRKRAADRSVETPLRVELLSPLHVEAVVARGNRVERGNLLHAFDHQNPLHGQYSYEGRESGKVPSATRWQATRCPASTASSAGSSTMQRATAWRQRAAKRHPRGTALALGRSPVRLCRWRGSSG